MVVAALAALRELEKKATPGPWKWLDYSGTEQRMFLEATGRVYGHVLKITWPELLKDEDADLIVALRNAAPALLQVAEAAQKWAEIRRRTEAARDELQMLAAGEKTDSDKLVRLAAGYDAEAEAAEAVRDALAVLAAPQEETT